MAWNFHHYYANKTNGLIGKLVLKDHEIKRLKNLRNTVRKRTKNVFEEAKSIAKDIKRGHMTQDDVRAKFYSTNIKYLSEGEQKDVAKLLHEMDNETLIEFLGLTPRFMTQGSFQYDTLNRPFHHGQEMDIDDGTYMPMTVFETEPKIGHQLLILLVDSSLKSLEAENNGWVFDKKQTCGRIKISNEKTHIDVPMYAIPKEQFLEKQVAMESAKFFDSRDIFESYDHFLEAKGEEERSYEVDSQHVNLALREGDKKWVNSDPKIVEDWFNDSCKRIGKHLRKVCRFMKAWRDAQWEVGGPSSISLMAATVNILDRLPHDSSDFGTTMKLVAENLPTEFRRGVESPDNTDDKPLFPPIHEHGPREQDIMNKLEQLPKVLNQAETTATKQQALSIINLAYGNRVSDHSLIISTSAVPAFIEEPKRANSPKKISSTMTSG